ncbi:hypothetical protein EC968_008358 [Mortierella alpina]|nr:hypothetical protein EC968_008358 [Mortierella alpina]
MIPTTNTSTAPNPLDPNHSPLKPRDPSFDTTANEATSVDRLAVEGLSIRTGPLPHEIYPPPQLEEYHQEYQQQQQQQQQQHQQRHQHLNAKLQQPHQQQQQQQQQHQHQQRTPPQIPQRPPAHMQYQPPFNNSNASTSHPKTMTTITATITTNNDDTRSVAFEEARQQEQKRTQRSTQLPPTVAAKVLTPAQQREAEADAYIQRAIELHENNELKEATYYFRLAAQSENPVGQLMYGLSLRHGWGCNPNPKEAISHLQRAAEYAMGELKELSPSSSANIQAIQRHTSRNHQNGAGAYAANASSTATRNQQQQQPLKRMGTIDRRSAMLTARKELVMALYELGMSFLKGWGVEKNKVVAFHYFKLGADLGDPDSQNETAQCFLDGIGTDKNAFEAARYYRLASAQGASQLGNSWIWKPKYDQYCEQQAAALAAESAERKRQQQQQQQQQAQQHMGGGVSAGHGATNTSSTSTFKPSSPPTSPTSNSIAAGLASMTVAGAMATPSATTAASSMISPPQSASKSRLSLGVVGKGAGAGAGANAAHGSSATGTGSGAGSGPTARQGRYSLAGDLISSSQLELKLKQAEELTSATIGSNQGQEAAAKKKHRWSLWNHRRGPSSS